MSGPRQVARIWHKNLRLRRRAGYGLPGARRGRFSGDVGPDWFERGKRCHEKIPYDGMVAAIAAADRTPGTEPYVCSKCSKWHVGHPRRQAS